MQSVTPSEDQHCCLEKRIWIVAFSIREKVSIVSRKEVAIIDYDELLNLAAQMGCRLTLCGAETFRVEESIVRILDTYGVDANVYAIPNCLYISIRNEKGQHFSCMHRIDEYATDMDSLERLSGLSRKICKECPSISEANSWLEQINTERIQYSPLISYLGNFFAGWGFSVFFGGNLLEAVCGGFCAIIAGMADGMLRRIQANRFVRTLIAAFLFAFPAFMFESVGQIANADMAIVGAIMPLIPGLMFTNAMRDVIHGDMNSSIIRLSYVVLLALAIAAGVSLAWHGSTLLWGVHLHQSPAPVEIPLQLFACLVACVGFSIMFQVHGHGFFLCPLGGLLTWLICSKLMDFGCPEYVSYLAAASFAAAYAEIMARVRKCPATAFLVISLVPLIPGAGLYYTMRFAVDGNFQACIEKGIGTLTIAGVMAVGVILINTFLRMYTVIFRK